MEKEREEQQFEREENERLKAAFNRFDSLYGNGKGKDSVKDMLPDSKEEDPVKDMWDDSKKEDPIKNMWDDSKEEDPMKGMWDDSKKEDPMKGMWDGSKDEDSVKYTWDGSKEEDSVKDTWDGSKEEDPAYVSFEDSSFEEDEYEFIIDRYIDLFNDPMARLAAEKGFEAYPYSSALLVKYCDALVIGKELGKALLILDEYKDSFPPNSDIYLSYSRVYIGMKDLGNARRYYQMAIDVESSPEEICDSIHTLAQDCMEIEMYKEALFYLDRTAELTIAWNRKHHEGEKAENIASFLFDYAFCSEKTGNEDKALDLYQKCLDIDPFNDIVWHNIGIIYSKKNLYKKAYEAYDYAIALNPKNISAQFNMGQLCIDCNLYDQAQKSFEECCKLEKDNSDAISALALVNYLKGDLNQAEILYRKALIFNPDHEPSINGLKEVQAERKLKERIKSRQKDNKDEKH